MAHLDLISHDYLVSVAAEIADLIDNGLSDDRRVNESDAGGSAADNSPLQLAETLSIWKFGTSAFEHLAGSGLSGDLSTWLEQTPFLHHQLRLNLVPAGFARSDLERSGGNKRVCDLNTSPFASRLNELFVLIEKNEHGDPVVGSDPVVRLLEVPSYHVFALWLFVESQLVSRVAIVEAPDIYTESHPEIFLSSEEFYMALEKAGPITDVA